MFQAIHMGYAIPRAHIKLAPVIPIKYICKNKFYTAHNHAWLHVLVTIIPQVLCAMFILVLPTVVMNTALGTLIPIERYIYYACH